MFGELKQIKGIFTRLKEIHDHTSYIQGFHLTLCSLIKDLEDRDDSLFQEFMSSFDKINNRFNYIETLILIGIYIQFLFFFVLGLLLIF